jgi:uncharacterized membrane protein
LQLLLIALLETLCAIVVSYTRFLSPINAIWMLGIPFATAWIANRNLDARLAVAVIGVIVGSVAPELLAHSVGYCLQ